MKTPSINHASIRAEGEGMNSVAPPTVPRAKLVLINAKVRLNRMMSKIDDNDRTQIMAAVAAITLGMVAKRMRFGPVLALTVAAGAGLVIGLLASNKAVNT